MSVQLILYPQNYNGYTFTTQNVFNEYAADGMFSFGLDTVTGTASSQPSQAVLTANHSISAWRGWNTTSPSTTAPSISSSGLTLTSNASTTSSTGIYQLIGNLTAGVSYELTINVTTFTSGTLYLGNIYSNNWFVSSTSYNNLGSLFPFSSASVVSGKITHTFTALGSPDNEVLVLDYQNNNGDSLVISSISIKETQAVPSGIYTDLADGQVICDLYEDEAIPLSLSIDDFKNVAEKTQSYSKDFHLPNTKRNNKIFGHIFEVTRSTDAYSFNPYIKTKAILKEDSYTIFEGFLQLIDINDKEGEISYNVNLYSEPVTLKDILDNRTFADINFAELNHDYTITNIQNSWSDTVGLELNGTIGTTSVAFDSGLNNPTNHTSVLKYPFVNWKGDWSIDASGNIGLINLEQVFRPFIQLRYLIKRIINEAGFEFVSDFFDTTEFKKLFMDFNWGQGIGSSEAMESFSTDNDNYARVWAGTSFTELDIGQVMSENPTGIAGTYLSGNTITATNDNTTLLIGYSVKLYNATASSQGFSAEWVRTGSSTVSEEVETGTISATGTGSSSFPSKFTYSGSFSISMQSGDTITPKFKANSINSIFQGNGISYNFPGSVIGNNNSSVFYFQFATLTTTLSLLHAIRGKINQWEFLKGIFTMFNLVVLKEDEVLRIELYKEIFITNSDSTQHNWTDKVDISEINLKPLELVKKTVFTYEDDEDDYSLGVYKKATSGYLYGTKNFPSAGTPPVGFSLLTGEEEIIATPFAPTLLRPATDLFDQSLIIPHIYSGNEDGTEFEDFENLPRILYNLGVKSLSTNTYYIPAQNNVGAINSETDFLQFGHLSEIPTTSNTVDYNFGNCQLLQPIGSSPTDNLYQTYYSPYYDELYNPDTRIMTMKVNLTPADIQNFRFYDTVVIKNREYRVNKIDYKPNTLAKVEFILIP